jgi:entericidin B
MYGGMKTKLIVLAFLALAACNTFEGAGKDIEKGGEAISGAANDVRSDM